jgi:hypothetical protein
VSKPDLARIRLAVPLSRLLPPEFDRVRVCNVCRLPSTKLEAWRECDERDRPKPGDDAIVYIATDHPQCIRDMEAHPRLYEPVPGDPGHFPLCGDCTLRQGMSCTHPALRANGGAGLNVTLTGIGGIVCTRGPSRCRSLLKQAVKCVGKVVACRRCTECEGEQHHFMGPESIPGEDSENAGFTCKHCPYTTPAEECWVCCDLFPLDILRSMPPSGGVTPRLCPECVSKASAR